MGTELIFSENEHFSRPPEGGEIMAVFRIEKTRDYIPTLGRRFQK